MSSDKYFLNALAVIFIPEKDKENNYSTIVFNFETENILKISKIGYEILYLLDKTPGLSLDQIISRVSQEKHSFQLRDKQDIMKFVEKMVQENVIFEN